MTRLIFWTMGICIAVLLTSCQTDSPSLPISQNTPGVTASASTKMALSRPPKENKQMKLKINNTEISVSWEDNQSIQALAEYVRNSPIQIETQRYDKFEQVGKLPQIFPTENRQLETQPGDIVLYQGNQIVLFFAHHSWSYTPLGRIQGFSHSEIKELLNYPKAQITISSDT